MSKTDAEAPRHTEEQLVRPVTLLHCDCEGFRKGNGIWFDTQDLSEFGYKSCPACHKPFKTWPSIEAYLADNGPNISVTGDDPSRGGVP